MTTEDAARRWAEAWRQGWETLDADRIVACYAEDARLSTEPFREPYRGAVGVRDYVTTVFAEEDEPRVWVAEPIVEGDRAAIAWWASLREDGADATLAGTSLLRFDHDGLVVDQWDAWNRIDERRDPPDFAPLSTAPHQP